MTPPSRRAETKALDPLLEELPFLPRLRDMAAAKGAFTLRQLASLPPTSLASAGSTTIADARVILERFLGRTWEEMAGLTPPRSIPSGAPPRRPTGWDELRLVLAAPLLGVHLSQLDVPTRVLNFAERQGFLTLGPLAQFSEARLLGAGGIGRIAVRHLFQSISREATRLGYPPTLPAPAAVGPVSLKAPVLHPARVLAPKAKREHDEPKARKKRSEELLEGWQRRLALLPPEPRRAMELLAGLDGSHRLTFDGAGVEMGVTGAVAHRLDARARALLSRDTAWMEEVRGRFAAALAQPRVRLARLAGDRFWAEIVLLPQALDYFAESVLEVASVIEVDRRLYLVKWDA